MFAGQHFCPNAPHPPQLLLAHMPPIIGQVVPTAVQEKALLVFGTGVQQPPPLHARPSQHGSPGSPQCTHRLLPEQIELAAVHPPLQHCWVRPPHWNPPPLQPPIVQVNACPWNVKQVPFMATQALFTQQPPLAHAF